MRPHTLLRDSMRLISRLCLTSQCTIGQCANRKVAQKFGTGSHKFEIGPQKFGPGLQNFGIGLQKFGIRWRTSLE